MVYYLYHQWVLDMTIVVCVRGMKRITKIAKMANIMLKCSKWHIRQGYDLQFCFHYLHTFFQVIFSVKPSWFADFWSCNFRPLNPYNTTHTRFLVVLWRILVQIMWNRDLAYSCLLWSCHRNIKFSRLGWPLLLWCLRWWQWDFNTVAKKERSVKMVWCVQKLCMIVSTFIFRFCFPETCFVKRVFKKQKWIVRFAYL